jgi:hypothetical protein
METTFGRRVNELIKLAFQTLSDVRVLRNEVSIERWRVDLTGSFGDYTIHISEISAVDWRKYAYYVLKNNNIFVDFDNSPDVYAIEMKYPEEPQTHQYEKIPHRHNANKSELVLTDEMTFEEFIEWLKTNLNPYRRK